MPSPRAVVVPFGVPAEGRGLGLGLAALVHAFAQVNDGDVAIAQLQSRSHPDDGARGPVEAFLSPAAWRDIAGRGDAPASVDMVVTGAFEPPVFGQGTLALLAFDPRDGATRAKAEAPLDGERAGATVFDALEQLWGQLGGGIGALSPLRELGWDALESVLRAERCALHDPERGGPHDRLAAMVHLGRAIGDAPFALYPAERLASIALEAAGGMAPDPKLAVAAVRALEGAVDDADAPVPLLEALGALLLRIGRVDEAERRMNSAIALAPNRPRAYALLAQALRIRGNLDGALSVLEAGESMSRGDALLGVERGMLLTARGDVAGAATLFRTVLALQPLNPVAFGRLASHALRVGDRDTAGWLIDAALGARDAHPDVLRTAIHLALQSEHEGISRASRVLCLCEWLLARHPNDGVALLASARALILLGEPSDAKQRLTRLERCAPFSPFAAEAQLVRLALNHPAADAEIQSVLRAAHSVDPAHLDEVASRGRRLGTAYAAWGAWLAAAIAERRRGRWSAARVALEAALQEAPGASPVRFELAGALLELSDAAGALAVAEQLVAADGPNPENVMLLSRALAASGRQSDAREVERVVSSMREGSDASSARRLAPKAQTHAQTKDGTWARLLSQFADLRKRR